MRIHVMSFIESLLNYVTVVKLQKYEKEAVILYQEEHSDRYICTLDIMHHMAWCTTHQHFRE